MSGLSRTFLRASRSAFGQQKGVNPLHQALGAQGAARYVNACRTYATVFERTKPHVNIGQSPSLLR